MAATVSKMAATVSNQKILNDDETVDGGLMAPCRRGENADSEISSDVSSDERFINKYVPPPRAFANSKENKDEGGKRRGTPKLDCRRAKSSSDAASAPPSPRARSLDISNLRNRTSFRIQGIDGEFDEIWPSLGLSGPDDFSIPAAAWEARKFRSSLDLPPRSRLHQKILNDDETVDGGWMAPCRRGESADSEISSDVSSDERFINKYVPPPRAFANSEENKDKGGKDRKPDYFHVSTPRGQATDSHSLAERERVRTEKFSERLKYLQDLVPGCSKIVGKSERLDEIIKYVQSLETQFMSTKAAAVTLSLDLNVDSFFAKDVKKASQSPITNKELAHCGHATDSHSVAERVRKEKFRNRLKYLEDLVPGCNKIKGCVGRLNKIIDYIEYLQVECFSYQSAEQFQSTKVAVVNPSPDFNIDSFFAKEVFPASTSMEFYAPDNGAHLGRPYQSGPNSEKKDMREQLSEECLTKSVHSFDDTTKQKSLPDLRTLTPLGQYFADEKILNKNKKIFNGAERFEDLMPPFTRGENPCPEISFHVRSKFTNKCLPHVFAISEENELNDKVVKFYSRQGTGSWGSLKHVHPATLEELGPENKGIISDLLRFVMEKEFYKKVGKAWTGFYSLYEPPGTDRLSLIGAMANYLEFDIYNLDLTSLPSIEELKKMLSSIRNRSLIAIQDFNHWPGMLSKFKTELTVPCLLKIFYHLFSSCGDEHVIVFTTQHRDRHDAALLCPVGTDMHIYAPSPQPLALPEEDDEIVGGGERVKVYSGLLQAKLDEESTDLGMEVEEGKGVKNLEEGMLEITKELCQEAEKEENQEFEVEEGNQEFTDPEKLETQDALLIQEREEEAKVEDRREMADDFMRTLGRCEKLNSEISLIQQYLAHASAHSKKNEDNDKSSVKVYSRRGRGCWDSMKLEHLATLEELGMDPGNKGEISDLLGFVRMKEFYKKEGKAWKKGYLLNEPKDETHVLSGKWVVEIQWNLFWFVRNKEFYKTKGDTWKRVYWLYEPPDTERSSLSVATANYLKLYTCDLDLTSIPSKLEQKDTLLSTRERSSIVIKDFDFKNESAISFPDGEHILSLSEKKIVRKTLKRKCRSMSILSLEDHKQHVDRRWEDAAKSHGAKRICRQLVIHRLSTTKRIHRQHGIHRRPFQRSATGLPNGGHILPLSEKKIMRKTLKRKCRSMSVLSLVDHQQHVDRRWEDAAKNIGVKRIFRQLVIHRVSIAKPICRQHGIHHRWPYQQDRGTMKGYTLGDKRPVEVIRLSMDGKLVSSLQVIYISWLGRFSPPPSTLPGGEIVGHIALSSSQFATTNSIAQRVGQDQSGSASFDFENERTREQEDPEEMYTSITSDDLRRLYGKMNRKDAAAGLGISVATFKRKCREFGIKRWPHVREKKVGRPPDQHGERNTSTACKMPLHNVHAGMEGEPVGQNQEANEFRRDFMEHSIALNAENDSIIAVYSETDVAMGYSKWAFQLEGQTMQSTTHPYRNNLVFSQPQIASIEVPNENMGSLQDRRDLLASQVVAPQQEPLLEGHVFGFGNWTVGSCSDLAPTQPMHPFSHATGSSENLENLLASVEEHLMEGNVSGSSMSDPALNQPMHTIHHTMATIPHMMPLPTERQDTGSVKIKATYEDTNIKFQFPLTSGIKELKEVMSMILERKLGSFKVEYKDVDGEWILMGLDEHVREYLQLLLGNKVSTELKVQDKVPNTTNFCDNCRCNNRRSVKRKKP